MNRCRRLIDVLLLALGILFIVFWIIDAGLGGLTPDEIELDSALTADEREAKVREFRDAYKLDDPLWMRFASWLGRVGTLDLGSSLRDPRAITTILGERLSPTLLLQSLALLMGFGLGIPIGVAMARRRGRFLDGALGTALYALLCVPNFWLATILVIYLATDAGLPLFPLEGLGEGGFLDGLHHLVLPVTCLGLPILIFVSRMTRAMLVESLASDWARGLRAAGISERRVVWTYGMRDVLKPLVAFLGVLLPSLIGGSIIVEQVFNIHGMGELTLDATFARDFPVLQALMLLTTLATLGSLLLADFLGRRLSPRGRLS